MTRGDKTSGIKAWAVAFAAGLFVLAPSVEAGFTQSQTINTKVRRKLENGHIYNVMSDLDARGATGFSAFYMDPNSTAVLYIAAGKTLRLNGGNATGMTGAGAGIEIPRGPAQGGAQ